jgi:hypothetical protein
MTFDRPLAAIDAAALDALVRDRVSEGRQLEYKETLPGEKDQDKREFLADISAFANSAGGDLIYGIREQGGVAAAVVGLLGLNLDQERLRLEQLARDGIRPRIPGLRLQPIGRGTDPPCLVVRVPRSPVGPHMVTLGGLNRFYGRSAGGRYPLDVDEIRTGFVAAETAAQRARLFRADRVAAIEAREGPVRLPAAPLVMFHVIPLTAWEGWGRVLESDDRELRQRLPTLLGGPVRDSRFTLEGWCASVSDASWVQLFRWGALEAVAALTPFIENRGISGGTVERRVIDTFSKYSAFLAQAGIDPPIALGLALVGVRGLTLRAQPAIFDPVPGFLPPGFDRDPVVVPETVAYDVEPPPDVVLRPLFDALWNAAGRPRSPHYRGGRWQPPGLTPSA